MRHGIYDMNHDDDIMKIWFPGILFFFFLESTLFTVHSFFYTSKMVQLP